MKIAIVSDSTAYIPKDLIEKHNIHIIPLSVGFGNEFYREEVDISSTEFYDKVREGGDLPTTSQPSVGAFVELYEDLAKDYDDVISIHISKELSGTYDTSITASTMVEGITVHSFDSSVSAMIQGFFVIEACEMVENGAKPEEIMNRLEDMKDTAVAYFMVDDLSHLQRGGRLSSGQALVGSLLRIKPILHLKDGFIVPYEKIRTRKRAINRLISLLEEDLKDKEVKRILFTHSNNREAALDIQKQLLEKYPDIDTVLSDLGPVIGTHLGEGAIGIGWYSR